MIVGGGPTGVELAAEIAVDFPDKKVTLVHEGTRLLDFIREKASAKVLNWLVSKKVEVILGQSVDLESSLDGAYVTSGGETILADCHFLCIGKPVGSSWLKETFLKDSLDEQGRLLVDSHFRVMHHNNIFAVGDIANTNVSSTIKNFLYSLYTSTYNSIFHLQEILTVIMKFRKPNKDF